MRWALLIVVLGMVACGGSDKSRRPAEPMLAIQHVDPVSFVDGGAIDPEAIERRELRCGRPSNLDIEIELPEDGRLTTSQFLASVPGLRGRLACVSVVYVDGVVSLPSNEVSFVCDPGPEVRRCWQR